MYQAAACCPRFYPSYWCSFSEPLFPPALSSYSFFIFSSHEIYFCWFPGLLGKYCPSKHGFLRDSLLFLLLELLFSCVVWSILQFPQEKTIFSKSVTPVPLLYSYCGEIIKRLIHASNFVSLFLCLDMEPATVAQTPSLAKIPSSHTWENHSSWVEKV